MPKPPDTPGGSDNFHTKDSVKIDIRNSTHGYDNTTEGDDVVIARDDTGDANYTVKTYGGDDYVDMRLAGGAENVVDTGDGNDTVLDSNYHDQLFLGDGNDTAEMGVGYGKVRGEAGSDTIKVYMEQLASTDLSQYPADPGGPFELTVLGGSDRDGSDIDTLQMYFSADQMASGMAAASAQGVDAFLAGTISSEYLMPKGEFNLHDYLESQGFTDVPKLRIGTDFENIQMYDQSETLVYDHAEGINIIT